MITKVTTETGKEMLQSVTPMYNKNSLALGVFEANGKVMNNVLATIRNLKAEMYPQNATWSIAYWEQMLGIKTKKNLSDSVRVQKVLFEMNKYFTVTRNRIENTVNIYVSNKNARVTEDEGEYSFTIEVPVNHDFDAAAIHRAVEEIKPAHLDFNMIHRIDMQYLFGTAMLTGEGITVYPWRTESIETKGTLSLASHIRTGEETLVYPRRTESLQVKGVIQHASYAESFEVFTVYPQ